MTETNPATASGTDAIAIGTRNVTSTPPDPTDPDTGGQKDWESEAQKWQSLARKHEERAKANSAAAKELEELRVQSMSDQERAVAEAKAAGRSEAFAEASSRIVSAEIRAAAAGRLGDDQLATLLEATNLAVFLTAEGDVDIEKVARFIDGIAPRQQEPTPGGRTPDLGQGARGGNSSMALNGDPLLRDLKAKLGIT